MILVEIKSTIIFYGRHSRWSKVLVVGASENSDMYRKRVVVPKMIL